MRLIQLINSYGERRVCLVEDNRLRLIGEQASVLRRRATSAQAGTETARNFPKACPVFRETSNPRSTCHIMPAPKSQKIADRETTAV
jgi:hypothetical protein